jgi:hypothetical protein
LAQAEEAAVTLLVAVAVVGLPLFHLNQYPLQKL